MLPGVGAEPGVSHGNPCAIKLIKGGGNVRYDLQGQFDLGKASATIDHAVHGSEAALDKARAWLGGGSVNGRIDHMLGIR